MRLDAINIQAQVIELDSSKLPIKANVGDILHVQVLAASKEHAVLKTSDGKTMTVELKNGVGAAAGEYLDLVVTGKKDGKVYLETLKNAETSSSNGLSQEQIKDLLGSFKLSASQRNIQIVQEMMNRQVPVNKDSMQTILNSLAKNQNLDVQKAVFMMANGLSFEEKNINMLNQYAESKIALGNQIKSIVNMLDEIDEPQILKNIISRLTLLQDETINHELRETAKTAANQILGQLGKQFDGKLSNNITDGMKYIPNSNNAESVQISHVSSDISSNVTNSSRQELQSNEGKIIRQILPLIKQMINEAVDNQITLNQKNSLLKQSDLNINDIKQSINNMTSEEVTEFLKSMPEVNKSVLEKVLTTENNQFNDRININSMKTAETEELVNLKREIRTILDSHFIKNTDADLADKLQIKEVYKDILLSLDAVAEELSRQGSPESLTKMISQTQENIKFMNSISQYNTFIQIPLNIWGQDTNGELYILKKSRKKVDPNNASVFLSLEMPNMGLTEVLITVLGKDVMCNFRLADEKAAALIRKSAGKLTDAISKLGYHTVDIGCGLIQKKTNLLEMGKAITSQPLTGKQSFDAKV